MKNGLTNYGPVTNGPSDQSIQAATTAAVVSKHNRDEPHFVATKQIIISNVFGRSFALSLFVYYGFVLFCYSFSNFPSPNHFQNNQSVWQRRFPLNCIFALPARALSVNVKLMKIFISVQSNISNQICRSRWCEAVTFSHGKPLDGGKTVKTVSLPP